MQNAAIRLAVYRYDAVPEKRWDGTFGALHLTFGAEHLRTPPLGASASDPEADAGIAVLVDPARAAGYPPPFPERRTPQRLYLRNLLSTPLADNKSFSAAMIPN
jgi:hypothetical protein